MERSTDINLLCLSKLQITGADEGMPVLFKYGDQRSVDIQLIFTIIPNCLLKLTQKMIDSPDIYQRKIYVYVTLNFVYKESAQENTSLVQNIESYVLDLNHPQMHNSLFEVNNTFCIDSTMLPTSKDVRQSGYFELAVSWNTNKDDDMRYSAFTIPVSIFEQFAKE